MAVTFTVLSRTLGKMLQKDSIDHFQEQHDKTFATKYSQGSLFQLKGGKVHKVTPLFKHIPADIPKIYNLKCKDALETITAS